MKKLLSLLLALAIVISCVSMVTFNASAEEATATPDALKLTIITPNTDIAHNLHSNGLFNADSSFNGTKTIVLAIKNIGDVTGHTGVTLQALFNHGGSSGGATWTAPPGTTYVNNNTAIAPGRTQLVTITVPDIVNGKAHLCKSTCAEGACSQDRAINTFWLRFKASVATTFLITCVKSYSNGVESNDYESVNKYLSEVYGTYGDASHTIYDPAVFEYRKGIQFTLTETVNATTATYANIPAGFTADMVENGLITTSYDVYNTSDHMVSFSIWYQNGYANIGHNYIRWIEPHKKVTITANIAVKETEDGEYIVEYYDSPMKDTPLTAELSGIYLRYQFDTETEYNTAGSSVIVVPTDFQDKIYNTKEAGPLPDGVEVTSLPNYEVQTTNPDPVTGIKLSADSDCYGKEGNLYNVYRAGYQNDPTFTGTLTATYSIYNPTNKEIKVNVYYQIGRNSGWGAPSVASGTISIAPGYKRDFKTTVPVENGLVTASGISKPLSQLLVRFDVTIPSCAAEGDYIVIEPTGDTPRDIHSPGYAQGYYTMSTVTDLPKLEYTPTPAPATPAPTKEVTNGDVSQGKTNWGTFDEHGGTITVVDDPEEAGNSVIYFQPKFNSETNEVGAYSSVFFDYAPAIIQNPVQGFYGSGAGEYVLKFRIKGDDNILNYPDTPKTFNLNIQSQAHASANENLPANSYLGCKDIILTNKWQDVTVSIPVSADFLKTLDLLFSYEMKDAYQLGIRLDGSGDKRPYGAANENFGYYIDDVTIETVKGFELIFNKDLGTNEVFARKGGLGLTEDMIGEDGYITRSYVVYNPNPYPVKFRMQFQAGDTVGREGWDSVMTGGSDEHVILAYSKMNYTLKLKTENGEVPYNVDTTTIDYCSLKYVSLRLDTMPGYPLKKGDTLYIESLNDFSDKFRSSRNYEMNSSEYSFIPLGAEDFPDYSIENKIEGANLEIGSSLTVNYFATVRNGIVPTLRVTRGNDVRTIDGTLITDGEYAGKYLFAYTGVNAQCMADNINAELLYGDALISRYNNYSVKQYALNQYGAADATLRALLTDMLHYGAAAQEYMNYKTDNLATKDINWTASDRTLPEIEDASVIRTADQPDPNNKVTAVGLNISYVNKIYFKLNVTDFDKVTIKVTKDETVIDHTISEGIVYTDAINATGFGDKYTITITNNETGAVNTVSYNVNAYIAAKRASDKLGNIVPALYNYGMSAQAYASLNQQ